MVLGLVPGHIVLDGDPAPHPRKGHGSPLFLAHVCYGKTAGWSKMPLGTLVGLGPGDIVLDGDPAEMETGRVNRRQLPVGSVYRSGRVDVR